MARANFSLRPWSRSGSAAILRRATSSPPSTRSHARLSVTCSTELISRGILDSLATLKLVSFVEERFGIAVEPHETDADYLNTIDRIAALVASKRR